MVYSILDWTLVPLLRKRIKRIEGIENIPKNKNFILAANHISPGDSLFLISSLLPAIKRKIRFITGQNVWELYGTRISTKFLGMIKLYDDRPAECLKIAKQFLLDGADVGIFPEGTLEKDSLIKPKTGMARLALWTKTPVLPVGIKCRMQRGTGLKPFLKVFFSKKPIALKIGKPITFDDLYNKEINKEVLDEVGRRVMKKIAGLIGEKYDY